MYAARLNVPHSTLTDPPPACLGLASQLTPALAVHLSPGVLELPLLSFDGARRRHGRRRSKEQQACAYGVCPADYGPCYGYSYGAPS